MTTADLASFFKIYNFFRGSGANENEIESFITNINSGYIPPGKAIELVNQIYHISKSELVPPDELPNYVRQKLEEKHRIDQEIQRTALKCTTSIGIFSLLATSVMFFDFSRLRIDAYILYPFLAK